MRTSRPRRSAFVLCFILTISLLLLVTPVVAGIFPAKMKFYTLKTPHFYIHYNEGIGPLAQEMSVISERVFERVTTRLDWKPWGRTHVVMTDKTDVSNGLASIIPSNYILLYIAPPNADSTLDHYKEYFDLLFTHEFTHIAHIDQHYRTASPGRWFFGKVVAPNGLTPAWMREGMAVYEESQLDPAYGRINSDFTRMVLRTAYYEGKFPRIDQIAGSSAHFPAGTGPYLFGGSFFDWLGKKFGEDRMYKYQQEYASSMWLFSLNNKARRVYGESFYKLWKQFRSEMAAQYEADKTRISQAGLTSLNPLVVNKNTQNYYTPRPGSSGAAYHESSMDEASGILIYPEANEKPIFIKRGLFGQMSFSKSGRYLAFSSLASVEPKTSHSEVFYYDLKDKKLFRVFESGFKKKSMRVMDPDFSPADGGQRWIVMVRDTLNTDQLYVFDTFEKKGYTITRAPEKTQFSNPRFSPDGHSIVVSRKDPDGRRDIVLYSHLGQELKRITSDDADDNHPIFSPDGRSVFFDSFRSGIANIFRADVNSESIVPVTNVLTGVFQPMLRSDGTLSVKQYGSERSGIFSTQINVHAQAPSTLSQRFGFNFMLGEYEPIDPQVQLAEVTEDGIVSRPFAFTDDGAEIAVSENQDAAISYDHDDDFDAQDWKDALNAFSQDPTSPEVLPDLDRVSEGRKTDRSEVLDGDKPDKKSKKSSGTTPVATAPKSYPSAYKDSLQTGSYTQTVDKSNPPGAHKYHALPQLLVPRYLIPSLMTFEDSVLLGFAIGRFDPLYRHSWTVAANYRSDARFAGGTATYIYSRFDPIFYLGGVRYVVDWGQVNGVNFFEQRHQAYAGVAYSYKKHKFNLAYFYEHRDALTNLAGVNLVNMKPYAGFRSSYTITNYESYTDSISQENGYRIKVGFEWTNTLFGSDDVNEERAVYADARYYLEMPWSNHHVLAFRAAGGWVWGDVQQFGAYRLGGPFGEGTGAGYSSRLFPMRGLPGITYGGDRAFMFSTEYRLPLVYNVNRGVGTWPIFLDKLYMDFFVDGGDIKFRTELSDLFTRMLISAGAELKGDVVLGYGLPMTFRVGYGIVLTNRDRLGTLTDPVTRSSLRYGSVYLQVGTSF